MQRSVRAVRVTTLTALAVALLLVAASLIGSGCGDGQSEASKNSTERFTEILGRAPAADSVAAQVVESGTLIVGIDGDYPPQSSIDPKTQQWTGFDVDVARELATRLGLNIEFVNPNWDAMAAGLKTDRYHVSISSLPITAAAKRTMTFTDPYAYLMAVAVNAAKNPKIATATDLKGKTVAAPALTSFAAFLQGIGGVTVKVYPTDGAAVDDLKAGVVDALLTSETDAAAIDAATKSLQVGEAPLFYEPLGAAVRKGENDLVTVFNKILAEMRADGTLRTISQRWYAGRDVTASPPEGVPQFGGGAK